MMVISLKAQACLELADRAGMIQGYKLRPDKIDRWLKTLHFGAHYYCEWSLRFNVFNGILSLVQWGSEYQTSKKLSKWWMFCI